MLLIAEVKELAVDSGVANPVSSLAGWRGRNAGMTTEGKRNMSLRSDNLSTLFVIATIYSFLH